MSFFEPCERLILFAKAGIDRSDLERRDILALSQFLQLGDYFLRLLSIPRHRIGMCEFCFGDRASPRKQSYRVFERSDGVGIPALLLKDQPKPRIGLRVVLIHLDGLFHLIESLVVLARVKVMPTQMDGKEDVER